MRGNEKDRIEYRIKNVSLRNKPQYDALSYTWGRPDEEGYFVCLQGNRFPVRENLWRALRHLRDKKRSLVLWIDVICITKEDIAERGHQVQQMREIYGGAACVHVWLGRPSHSSDRAMEFTQRLGRNIITRSEIYSATVDLRYDGLFNALQGLLDREYWH